MFIIQTYIPLISFIMLNDSFVPFSPNVNTTESILFITSYKDIKRSLWSHYTMTNDDYVKHFLNILNYMVYDTVVFVEQHIFELIMKATNNIVKPNITFINMDNFIQNTFFTTLMEKDKAVMNSEIYKKKLAYHRRVNPEHLYSEYNLINHSKISFIKQAKEYYNYDFYAWIDFGYIRNSDLNIPRNINVKAFPNKIMYSCFRYPDINNRIDPNVLLQLDDIIVMGGSFILPNCLVDTYEILYEENLLKLYDQHISDDDQNVVVQIYYNNPELFHLLKTTKWFDLYHTIPT
jgi:hypothetical protein